LGQTPIMGFLMLEYSVVPCVLCKIGALKVKKVENALPWSPSTGFKRERSPQR